MALHLLVGLGNPGPQYAATRHNVGFLVVGLLFERWRGTSWRNLGHSLVAEASFGGEPAVLAQPQTYMNRSGLAVKALVDELGIELSSTLVIHDDLDLPFGSLRIRTGGGHGGHNGLRSLLEALESARFLRLKVGIGRPLGGEDVVNHVLSPFRPEERTELPALLSRAAEAAEAVVLEGPLRAMNRFHA